MLAADVKDPIPEQQIVGEANKDTTEEKDAARISWLQWLASKSKLTTKSPADTKLKNPEENIKDPFQNLESCS